jgi:type III secretion protein W
MTDPSMHVPRIPEAHLDVGRAQRAQAQQLAGAALEQIESQESLTESGEEMVFNPLAMANRFARIDTRFRRGGSKEESDKTQKEGEKKFQQVQKTAAIAEDFSRRSNQELTSKTLLLLRQRILKDDTAQDVIRKVMEFYPDHSLADEALDFLIETAENPEMARTLKEAKEQFNTSFSREIKAGRNINAEARAFSEQGLGSPTALRDMYREITGTQREPNVLFEQLSTNFGYEKMKKVIEFMLHSLGSDIKSQGPSIERGQLHRLMTETRVLQAILGVYRFFRSRMKLIQLSFTRYNLTLPQRITFEALAKQYMRYLQERYPSSDKVLQMAIQLGIAEEIIAEMIIFTQLRDACRQIAPRLFKSEQHRQDTLRSFMDALELIEEELEEEDEEDGKDPSKKKKKKKFT